MMPTVYKYIKRDQMGDFFMVSTAILSEYLYVEHKVQIGIPRQVGWG